MALTLNVLMILVAYLFGSISSAVLICKLMGYADPRTQGSKNPGATNVLRIGGKKAAILTLIFDCLKGVIPVLLAKQIGFEPTVLGLVVGAAFLGHLFPIFFNFKGGKGVATAFGCLMAFNYWIGIGLLICWLTTALIFRYSSLAALMTALFAPLFTWWFSSMYMTTIVIMMSALLIWKHKNNIANLFAGVEKKIGEKG